MAAHAARLERAGAAGFNGNGPNGDGPDGPSFQPFPTRDITPRQIDKATTLLKKVLAYLRSTELTPNGPNGTGPNAAMFKQIGGEAKATATANGAASLSEAALVKLAAQLQIPLATFRELYDECREAEAAAHAPGPHPPKWGRANGARPAGPLVRGASDESDTNMRTINIPRSGRGGVK